MKREYSKGKMAEPTPGTAWKSKGRRKRSALAAKHLLALVILALISFGLAGCGYIGYWMRAGGSDVSLTDAPDLEALRELAPENCHCLQGSFVSDRDLHEPLLVVAISRQSGDPEIATTRILRVPVSGYAILLPKGNYELVVFADLDGDGFFRSDEVVGRTAAGSAVVSPDRSPDGFLVEGPSVHLDLSRPATCDLPVDIRLTPGSRGRIFKSLDDDLFGPRYGTLGLYNPSELLDHTQGFFFGLEGYDPRKTTVIFVHGSTGTPRDWKTFVEKFDRERFQPWFFYYPSGMSLRKLGVLLAGAIRNLDREPGRNLGRVVIISHSMGGLISWAAINDLCVAGVCPSYLKLFISLSAPYGGIESLRQGVERLPAVVPSWRDIAPESDLLRGLYTSGFPPDMRFCLFFGYRDDSKFRISENSDGAVALKSQLEPGAQRAASRIRGFDATHRGILVNDEAITAVLQEIDAVSMFQDVRQVKVRPAR